MPRRQNRDAVALLKADHRKVEGLFEKFEKASRADIKQGLVREICTELCIHAAIEEEIFYPACHGQIGDEALLDEAYVEHDSAKVLIAELIDGDPDMQFYDAKVKVLSEMIAHHVREEEKRSEGLFAEARKAGLDFDALGQRMMARKEALKKEFQAGKLPAPRTRSFTGHALVQSAPLGGPAATP